MPEEKGIVTATQSNTQYSPVDAGLLVGTEASGSSASVSSSIVDSVFLNGKKDIEVLAGNGQFEGQIGQGQSIQISFVIQAPDKIA